MSKFNPNIALYGKRVTVYDDRSVLDIGYLDEIVDQNTFIVDGVTFYIDQSDDFCVDGDELIIYNAVIVD